MTLKVTPGGVENTDSTEVRVGGKVTVGGDFTNSGKVKVFEGGSIDVNKNLINTGDISVNDPEKIKQIIIESLKTTSNVAEFGTQLLKKLGLSL